MTKVKIDTELLLANVDKTLSEIKTNLQTVSTDASNIRTSLIFSGSDKIANIPTKIDECITSINNTIEWYKDCCYNYDQFSHDSVVDIDSLVIDKFKVKNYEIKK